MSNQNLTDNTQELTEEEKQLLIEIIQNHIIKIRQEIRQNELIINNPPLRCQYNESYIAMLYGKNIEYKDKINRLKRLVNKIFREEMYKEEDH